MQVTWTKLHVDVDCGPLQVVDGTVDAAAEKEEEEEKPSVSEKGDEAHEQDEKKEETKVQVLKRKSYRVELNIAALLANFENAAVDHDDCLLENEFLLRAPLPYEEEMREHVEKAKQCSKALKKAPGKASADPWKEAKHLLG